MWTGGKRYGGNLTTVFIIKIACGFIVLITSLTLVVWRAVDPQVLSPASGNRLPFVFISLIMLAAAGTAGFFGGKTGF